MSAIVSGFNISCLPLASLVGIDVDCSEKLAYTVERFEFLPRASIASDQRMQMVGEVQYYRIWTEPGRRHCL
jgi:hypothetical protein